MKKKCFLLILSFVIIIVFNSCAKAGEYGSKEYCQKIFGLEDGTKIYEAYTKIAKLKYVPEEPKIDVWQTPNETAKLKCGDCEDAVTLLANSMPSLPPGIKGWLVWGLVIFNEGWTYSVKAHAWFELEKGEVTYVVEGFEEDSKSSCGIIPIYIINNREDRQPILRIPLEEFNDLKNVYIKKENSSEEFQVKAGSHSYIDSVMLSANTNKEVSQFAYITSRFRTDSMYVPHAMHREFSESWCASDIKKAEAKDFQIHKIYEKLHELMTRMEKGE